MLSLFTFFFFSPALASSCLYLCSELKQRSLNHIRYGSFAIPHPLCRNSAPALTLLTFWLLFPLVPSFLHPYFFRHHTHYRPISRKQRWLKYLLHYRTSTTPSILDPPTFFNHSFFCAALCTLPSSPLSKLNWTKRLVCARLASSLLRGPEPQAGANILPPSGSLSFRFFWSGQPQNLISQHLSHCAVTHFFFFFFHLLLFPGMGDSHWPAHLSEQAEHFRRRGLQGGQSVAHILLRHLGFLCGWQVSYVWSCAIQDKVTLHNFNIPGPLEEKLWFCPRKV